MAKDVKKRGSKGPSKNAVQLGQAKAAEATANAQAKAAETQLETLKLQAAERASQRADERRAADKSPGEQIRQGVINVGAPVAGMAVGYKLSKVIEGRHNKTVAVRNEQIGKLAIEARKTMSSGKASTRPAKLQGIVSSADKLGLGKVKGPLGLAPAGLLLVEGAYSRFVLAPSIENETAKETMTAVGTASAFAATTLVGERALQNATPSALPAARDVATIETAKNMAGAPAAQSAGQVVKKTLVNAGKRALLPLAVGVTVFAASQKAAKAGESSGTVAKEGGKAGLDLLTGGAVSEFGKAKSEGLSDNLATGRAIVAGVANTLTLGTAGMISEHGKSRPLVGYNPAAGARKYRESAQKGRAYLNAGAESKAAQVPNWKSPASAKRAGGSANRPDGRTEGYSRVNASGLVVHVQGYSTPKR